MISILSYVQTEVYTINDGTTHIRAQLVADFDSELPSPTGISGFTLEQGSTAIIATTGDRFMLSGGGAWFPQRSASISSLVNDISALQSDMQIAANSISYLETAAADLINDGAKNMLDWSASPSTTITITDNQDGTFTAAGTVPTGSVTSILLGRIYGHAGEDLYLSGCPAGGSQTSGYSLLIANEAGSMVAPDEGSGLDFTAPAGEQYFRVYARFRAGTYTALTFSPMVCRQSYARYTKKFVPYSPSNAELIKIIRSYHP